MAGKPLKQLVIHCTDTLAGRAVTSAEIRNWHTLPPPKGRGWKQVGYSDMIHLDGRVENLVPYNGDQVVDAEEITNGAAGYNSCSRHVVYVGGRGNNGLPFDTRTDVQKKALEAYVKRFLALHPGCTVAGHSQLTPKACPSFDVPTWLRSIGIPESQIYRK